jgi:hypothetical protein
MGSTAGVTWTSSSASEEIIGTLVAKSDGDDASWVWNTGAPVEPAPTVGTSKALTNDNPLTDTEETGSW